MDTWSIAKISLDAIFALILAGSLSLFLYRREKRLQGQFAATMTKALEWAREEKVSEEQERPKFRETTSLQRPRTEIPIVRQASTETTNRLTSARMSRAEKYLEAVRMYRQGNDRKEIEKNLGISFMELELLGRLK